MQKKTYRVVERETNTPEISSFVLKPTDGSTCQARPGQYLVLEIPLEGQDAPLRREYSISRWDDDSFRITIKREPAPADHPEYPEGKGSSWAHDHLKVGDEIQAFGPAGGFTLDEESDLPVVLLSGGVGLTPVMAMAQRLAAEGKRKTWFIHGCENGSAHAFKDETDALAASCALFKTAYVYRSPEPGNVAGKDYHSAGFVTADVLKDVLPMDRYQFYLCGPGPFMSAIYDTLSSLGVSDADIYYEFFGPATLLKKNSVKPQPDPAAEEAKKAQPSVTFAKSGLTLPWDPELENLLDFAEEQGLSPDFSCRSGTCSTCTAGKLSGTVSYLQEPLDELEETSILLCSAYPTSDITLDL